MDGMDGWNGWMEWMDGCYGCMYVSLFVRSLLLSSFSYRLSELSDSACRRHDCGTMPLLALAFCSAVSTPEV